MRGRRRVDAKPATRPWSKPRRASSAASTCSSTTSASARGAGLEATTDAEWQEAFDQTLFPAIRMSRLAVPHIRKRGGGAIVIVSSIFGREAGGRMTYNAVKAAEISLDQVAGAAAGQGSDPRRVGRARLDPVRRRIVVEAPAGRSGRHRRRSSSRSCRSAASARPKKSAPRSRFSRRRGRAGSAGRPSSSTAASRRMF